MTKFIPLFPVEGLAEGSHDLGPNGPIRHFQTNLISHRPRLAIAIGLIADGIYGPKTAFMVGDIQDVAIEEESRYEEEFPVDCGLGPNTVDYIAEELWGLDLYAIPFVAGGECMYRSVDMTELAHWPPAADELEEAVNRGENDPDEDDLGDGVLIGIVELPEGVLESLEDEAIPGVPVEPPPIEGESAVVVAPGEAEQSPAEAGVVQSAAT